MKLRQYLTEKILFPLRILPAAHPVPKDTHSPEYLYVVQQSKRLSLLNTLGDFKLGNFFLWPVLIGIVLLKWIDLVVANALIRSLINEYDLLHRVANQTDEKSS